MVRAGGHRQGKPLDFTGQTNNADFTSQSRIGREVHRVTGMSPARLDALRAYDDVFRF